jgi:hypothetical protein
LRKAKVSVKPIKAVRSANQKVQNIEKMRIATQIFKTDIKCDSQVVDEPHSITAFKEVKLYG